MRVTIKYLLTGLLASIGMLSGGILAAADQEGGSGPIHSIHLRSTAASSSAFWNWVVIAGPSGEQTYYWGGSVCPGKHLSYSGNSDAMVDALAEYATFPDMCITPYYKNGQGGYRCLVTFTAAIRVGRECGLRPQ
ncbi:MAG: hypothetical protein PVJ33_12885 [Lysobacterales bacterium]|jgi:hypothetical protein